MNKNIERNLGEQPLAKIMAAHELETHDIVLASDEQITHKMVARAIKGRRLTTKVQAKILNALNNATEKKYALDDIFSY